MRSLFFRGFDHIAFVCGCGHTGTTLMATILSAHPDVFVPYQETEVYLRPWWRAIGSLRRLRAAALASGRLHLIEKTPRHVRRIAQIRRSLPRAKFLIMVRDGRDVTASLGRRKEGDFASGLARWLRDTEASLEQRNNADTLVVRYEDLVSDPSATIRTVCVFLGVPFVETMLDYHKQTRLWYHRQEVTRTDGIGRSHEDLRNWQVNQPIFDGRGRWKSDLPEEFVAAFRIGRPRELMDAFGYSVD
ncbi:MAG: sulfotransferase [Devosia sp.]